MTVVALRRAAAGDSEFCYQLQKAAMGNYIAAIWGWDEPSQRDFHTRVFNPARWQIITADGVDIGMIDVEYRLGETYLARIEIDPHHQSRGIGTQLIQGLIDQAMQEGDHFALDVLVVNDRARALYRHLGMVEAARHGDDNIKIAMRYAGSGRQTT